MALEVGEVVLAAGASFVATRTVDFLLHKAPGLVGNWAFVKIKDKLVNFEPKIPAEKVLEKVLLNAIVILEKNYDVAGFPKIDSLTLRDWEGRTRLIEMIFLKGMYHSEAKVEEKKDGNEIESLDNEKGSKGKKGSTEDASVQWTEEDVKEMEELIKEYGLDLNRLKEVDVTSFRRMSDAVTETYLYLCKYHGFKNEEKNNIVKSLKMLEKSRNWVSKKRKIRKHSERIEYLTNLLNDIFIADAALKGVQNREESLKVKKLVEETKLLLVELKSLYLEMDQKLDAVHNDLKETKEMTEDLGVRVDVVEENIIDQMQGYHDAQHEYAEHNKEVIEERLDDLEENVAREIGVTRDLTKGGVETLVGGLGELKDDVVCIIGDMTDLVADCKDELMLELKEVKNLLQMKEEAAKSTQTFTICPPLSNMDIFVGRIREINLIIRHLLKKVREGGGDGASQSFVKKVITMALTDSKSVGDSKTLVEGSGGIGKTALASIIAHLGCSHVDLKERFPDGVIFLRVGENPDLGEKIRYLAGIVGVQSFSSTEDTRVLIASKLAKLSVLFILDDVWSVDDLKYFSELLGSKAVCLITSRRKLCDVHVHVDGLPLDDSVQLLQNVFGEILVEKAMLETIARRCLYIPQCLIAIAKQFSKRCGGRNQEDIQLILSKFLTNYPNDFITYNEIQRRALDYLKGQGEKDYNGMLRFIKSLSILPNNEEIDISVLKKLCKGRKVDFLDFDLVVMTDLDFYGTIKDSNNVIVKLTFHDLQLEFIRSITVEEETTIFHESMIKGYTEDITFYDSIDEYFLNHFVRHLKQGKLVEFVGLMAENGALAVMLHERSGHRKYLNELFELAVQVCEKKEFETTLNVLKEEVIWDNGTSLLFTLSLFLESESPFIKSMSDFIERRNDPVFVVDFIYKKEEIKDENSVACLFLPEVTSKLIVSRNKSNSSQILDYDFISLGETECEYMVQSEDSSVFAVMKRNLQGYSIQVCGSQVNVLDEFQLTFVDLPRSIDNGRHFVSFWTRPIAYSYLVDMVTKKTYKFIKMGCLISPNGGFIIIHSGKSIFAVPVTWLNGRDGEIVVDDLIECSVFECKEHVSGVFVSNERIVARFSVDSVIIKIDSKLSLGYPGDIRGVVLAFNSNFVVTPECCFDISTGKEICSVGYSYPLETSSGIKWMRCDTGAKRLVLSQDKPTSGNRWIYHECKNFIARHNKTNFVDLYRKDDLSQVFDLYGKDDLSQVFRHFEIDNVYDVTVCDRFVGVQRKDASFFIFDVNSSRIVYIGKRGGDFSFSDDSTYLFFFYKDYVKRLDMSSIVDSAWSKSLKSNSIDVKLDYFDIPGIILAFRYPIINNILSVSDGWLYKHPISDPEKRDKVMEWVWGRPRFCCSPRNDLFNIFCDDGSSIVFVGDDYHVVRRGFDLASFPNITVVNSLFFLSIITSSKTLHIQCPFRVDHIFKLDQKLIMCIDDNLYSLTVKGPIKGKTELMKTVFEKDIVASGELATKQGTT